MGATKDKKGPSLLDVVALLSDLPAQRLARGQVGTIVEQLDENISHVEFSDEQGRAAPSYLVHGTNCSPCTTFPRRPDSHTAE